MTNKECVVDGSALECISRLRRESISDVTKAVECDGFAPGHCGGVVCKLL